MLDKISVSRDALETSMQAFERLQQGSYNATNSCVSACGAELGGLDDDLRNDVVAILESIKGFGSNVSDYSEANQSALRQRLTALEDYSGGSPQRTRTR